MKIVIPNERPMSWNILYTKHWRTRNAESLRVHALVKYSIPPIHRKLFKNKVDINVTAYFKNRPYDSSNIAAKLYEDGLKGIVITDDTIKYVGKVTTESRVDKDNPRLEIEIIERG